MFVITPPPKKKTALVKTFEMTSGRFKGGGGGVGGVHMATHPLPLKFSK